MNSSAKKKHGNRSLNNSAIKSAAIHLSKVFSPERQNMTGIKSTLDQSEDIMRGEISDFINRGHHHKRSFTRTIFKDMRKETYKQIDPKNSENQSF